MLKRLALSTATALAVSAGLAGAAAPASAAAGDCPSARLCLWFNSGYAGARSDLRITDGNLSNELFNDGPSGRNGWGVQVEDNAASVANRTSDSVYLYPGRNCGGELKIIFPGEEFDLSTVGLKNKVSSVAIWAGGQNLACNNVNSNGY